MQALRCEMCNGTDMIKQDGVYVCQYCGMKYTLEEAKKLIEGTVKIDNSDFVKKYLQNARRAKEKEDWAETEKYYNLVEQNDPSNIEAIFYSSYGKAKSSLVDGDLYKRQAVFKTLQNCISIIDDNFQVEKEEENREIIKQISDDIIVMACSEYVYNQRKNGYGIVTWTDKMETVTLFNNLHSEFAQTLKNIIEKYSYEQKNKTVYLYELVVRHYKFMLDNGYLANRQIWRERLKSAHVEWHEIDPSHEIPYIETTPSKPSSTGGCYVATAVYGSYDCPQVWTLRRYRDNILAQTIAGRFFIKTYYAISPTLVAWLGETQWFKKLWRSKLDRMVKMLQDSGVADAPYEDREW